MSDLNERMQQIRDLLITPVTDDEARSIVALLDKIEAATPAPQAAPSDLTREEKARITMTAMLDAHAWGESLGLDPNDDAVYACFYEKLFAAAPAVAITQAAPAGTIEIDGATFTAAEIKTRITELDAEAKAYHEQLEAAGARIEVLEAITQAATSEPVAVGITYRDMDGCADVRLDVEALMHVPAGTIVYAGAAPVAHLAGTTPNTEAPSDERMKVQALIDGAQEAMTYGLDNPNFNTGRTPRGLITDAIAALSAQQAGVQEEDAENERRETWKNGYSVGFEAAKALFAQAGVQEAPSEDAKDAEQGGKGAT